jgi:hypothetical protein
VKGKVEERFLCFSNDLGRRLHSRKFEIGEFWQIARGLFFCGRAQNKEMDANYIRKHKTTFANIELYSASTYTGA